MADQSNHLMNIIQPPARQPELREAPWLYRNGNYFSPGGLMQEAAYAAGLTPDAKSYGITKNVGNLIDLLSAGAAWGPLAGRAVLGKAASMGQDARIADSLMRYAPPDTPARVPQGLGPGAWRGGTGQGYQPVGTAGGVMGRPNNQNMPGSPTEINHLNALLARMQRSNLGVID